MEEHAPSPDLPLPKDDLVEVPFRGDLLVMLDVVLFLSDSARIGHVRVLVPWLRRFCSCVSIRLGRRTTPGALSIGRASLPLATRAIGMAIRCDLGLVPACRTHVALCHPLVETFVRVYIMHVELFAMAFEDVGLSCAGRRPIEVRGQHGGWRVTLTFDPVPAHDVHVSVSAMGIRRGECLRHEAGCRWKASVWNALNTH